VCLEVEGGSYFLSSVSQHTYAIGCLPKQRCVDHAFYLVVVSSVFLELHGNDSSLEERVSHFASELVRSLLRV